MVAEHATRRPLTRWRPVGRMAYSIAGAALLLLLGNAASRVLGLGREIVIYALFGRTAATSAFATAATVPTMLYDLLVGGAISAALIPVLSDQARQSERSAAVAGLGRVAGSLLALTILATAVLVAVLELAAPLLVVALGGAALPNQSETTAMVRIMLPGVILLGAAGIVQATLQARGIFRYTAMSQAGFNLGIIVAALALGWALGPVALALGVLLGAALQLALQVPGMRDVPLRLVPDLSDPDVRRALRLYGPVAAGLVVSQAAIVLDRYLANMTGDESVATMRAATTLVQLPLGLIATATAFAVLPTLARQVEVRSEFTSTLALGVRLAILAMVPVTVGLVLLREPVLRLLFERGAFGPADTAITGEAFLWYAPQMPFWAVDQLLIFAFYARKDTLTPVLVGVGGTLLYLLVALSTVGSLGMFGLILANTVQNSAHCLIMYAVLVRIGRGLGGHGVERLLIHTGAASAALVLVYLMAVRLIGSPPSGAIGNLVWLAIAGGAMTATAIAVLGALRTPELAHLVAVARRGLRRVDG